ncbi:hypothetical protein [Pyruvatibacter sp.]|uniref:hypothetical protein n=1 Tax=Pyruvatibacter sp. TaxID=1981328 RepID=UPI0032EE2F9B
MKVANGIRNTFHEQHPFFERLAEEVEGKLGGQVVQRGWFFVHRLKELESFALKVETGRVEHPDRMDDFFACTIVVPTVAQIDDAETLVRSIYKVVERRPNDKDRTHKKASDFVFDDLRIYLQRQPSDTGRNADLDELVFEVQIKTILQHAWSIASHDLIYKTDAISWSKERIAFQVKAMLEHAEIAIAEAEQLAKSSVMLVSDQNTEDTLTVVTALRSFWDAERLPTDIKRLAENVRGVLEACELQPKALPDLLEDERNRIGFIPKDLAPYAFFVQALAHAKSLDLEKKLNSHKNRRIKIFVHDDMELPTWMKDDHKRIVRLKKNT